MNYRIIYTPSYAKRTKRFLQKRPELLVQYEKTLKLLELNPHHPSLHLHQLKGKLKDLHSPSINVPYRITLELLFREKDIILINIGTHVKVYFE